MNRVRTLTYFWVFFFLSCTISSANAEVLKIVTTLKTYADLAQVVGGEYVEVKNIAAPQFDPHFIEPRPSDILKTKQAALFIHSGLDLEAWRDPLLDAVTRSDLRYDGERQLNLSLHLKLLQVPSATITRAAGDIHVFGNPHYWLDPRNGLTLAADIAAKLVQIDPAHESYFQKNLADFQASLGSKIKAWQAALAPYRGTNFVGYHNGWVYLMNFAGLNIALFLEPKPGIPPTPQQVQVVTAYLRTAKAPGIIRAIYNPAEVANHLSQDTGVPVLVLSQGVGDLPEAVNYVSLFDYNVAQLLGVLRHD